MLILPLVSPLESYTTLSLVLHQLRQTSDRSVKHSLKEGNDDAM